MILLEPAYKILHTFCEVQAADHLSSRLCGKFKIDVSANIVSRDKLRSPKRYKGLCLPHESFVQREPFANMHEPKSAQMIPHRPNRTST